MRRSFVAVVVSWVVVVAIGSTLVWAVISHVGDGLVTTADTPRSSSTSGASRTPSTAPTRASTAPGKTESPSVKPSVTPPGDPSSSAAPQPQRATWQGLGGTVVAECVGGAVRQVSVQPDPGFRVEVGNPGPEELEVEFEGREDEEGSSSHVRAVCVSGAPRFTAETDD